MYELLDEQDDVVLAMIENITSIVDLENEYKIILPIVS